MENTKLKSDQKISHFMEEIKSKTGLEVNLPVDMKVNTFTPLSTIYEFSEPGFDGNTKVKKKFYKKARIGVAICDAYLQVDLEKNLIHLFRP